MHTLHEVGEKTKLFIEHSLTEMTLEGALVTMAATMQYVGAVVWKEDVTCLAAKQTLFLDKTLDDEISVAALEVASACHLT